VSKLSKKNRSGDDSIPEEPEDSEKLRFFHSYLKFQSVWAVEDLALLLAPELTVELESIDFGGADTMRSLAKRFTHTDEAEMVRRAMAAGRLASTDGYIIPNAAVVILANELGRPLPKEIALTIEGVPATAASSKGSFPLPGPLPEPLKIVLRILRRDRTVFDEQSKEMYEKIIDELFGKDGLTAKQITTLLGFTNSPRGNRTVERYMAELKRKGFVSWKPSIGYIAVDTSPN
jgi:hypothetical protein